MKKVLLVFDLNKILFTTTKGSKFTSFDPQNSLEHQTPNYKSKDIFLYFRPGRNEFLDFIFVKNRPFFEVGVWSSLGKDHTSTFAKVYFERYYRNLAFITATRREEYEGIKNEYDPNPIAVKRDLGQLFQKFPDYDMNNTIVISTFKNLIEKYQANDLIVKSYDPVSQGFSFDLDHTIHALNKFLRGVKLWGDKGRTEDVRTILNAKSLDFMEERD